MLDKIKKSQNEQTKKEKPESELVKRAKYKVKNKEAKEESATRLKVMDKKKADAKQTKISKKESKRIKKAEYKAKKQKIKEAYAAKIEAIAKKYVDIEEETKKK